jgi:hypothetical protein
MNPTLVHSAAWAAAWATVLWQRLLLPALLLAFDFIRPASHESRPKTHLTIRIEPATSSTSVDMERMTCAQLREMAGTNRHLSKRELIARIRSNHLERTFG